MTTLTTVLMCNIHTADVLIIGGISKSLNTIRPRVIRYGIQRIRNTKMTTNMTTVALLSGPTTDK